MSKAKKRPDPQPGKKRPYRKPELAVHGDIRTLTRTKAGTKTDGTNKPATRASGLNA